jgi:hypothetical protein
MIREKRNFFSIHLLADTGDLLFLIRSIIEAADSLFILRTALLMIFFVAPGLSALQHIQLIESMYPGHSR